MPHLQQGLRIPLFKANILRLADVQDLPLSQAEHSDYVKANLGDLETSLWHSLHDSV